MNNHPDFFNQANRQERFVCSLRKIVKTAKLSLFLFIFLTNTGAINVCGQDTEPTPETTATPAEEKKEETSAPPAPKAVPLEGKVEGAENIHIEPKIQAYRSVKDISRNIADDIYKYNPGAKTFILYRGDDYKAWQNYRLNKNRFEEQMKGLKCNYRVWLSLTNTVYEPLSDPPNREFFKDIPSNDPCYKFRTDVEATAEFKKLKELVTNQDEFLRKYNAIEAEIEILRQRLNLVDLEILALKTSPKDKSRKNKLFGDKTALTNAIMNKRTELSAAIELNSEMTESNSDNNFPQLLGGIGSFISPVTGLVGTALDLISYFRTDVAFSGTTVDLSSKQNSVRASVTNALQIRYCQGTNYIPAAKSENLSSKDREAARRAERAANIGKIREQCVAVYDPYLFTPDVVFQNGRISNGTINNSDNLPDGRTLSVGTLPDGVQLMRDLIGLREQARMAISGFDFQNARVKSVETKIAALKTAIAADDTAIKDYTSVLITLVEKGKEKDPMTATALAKITDLLDRTKKARETKENNLTRAENDLKRIKIPDHLDYLIDSLKVMNASFDKFSDAFTKTDDKSGLSPQMLYERAARLDVLFTDYQIASTGNTANTAYWLDINALEMEGNTRVRKNIWRYFFYPDISHNGGSVVQFALSDASGRVLLTNTEDNLRKFQKSSNVAKPQ